MNEKEIIEEMAKEISESNILCKDCGDYGDTYCTEAIANTLYKAGYRKIPEGSVVLSTEDYSDYLTLQSNYTNAKERCEKLQADNERLYKNLGKFKESVRKETAKEILRDIKYEIEDRNGAMLEEDLSVDATILQEVLNEIAKQYGVEI